MSEEAVKLVVLSLLPAMAGFYQKSFRMKTETSVQIALKDAGEIVCGRIDILVLQERFWVVVVESKEAGFSLKDAIVQSLSYMLATPHPQQPAYGLATNGIEFRFIKLIAQQPPQYGLSDLLTLQRRENDLYRVLEVLKQVGRLVQASSSAKVELQPCLRNHEYCDTQLNEKPTFTHSSPNARMFPNLSTNHSNAITYQSGTSG